MARPAPSRAGLTPQQQPGVAFCSPLPLRLPPVGRAELQSPNSDLRTPISELRSPVSDPRLSILQFLFAVFLCTLLSHSAEVTLAWDPNAEEDLDGYRLHYGLRSQSYMASVDVGSVTNYSLLLPFGGEMYYFAVTAYNTNGLGSAFSNEVSCPAPEETLAETNHVELLTSEDQSFVIPWQSQSIDIDTAMLYVADPPALGQVLGVATSIVYEPRPDLNGIDQCRLILTDTNRNVLKLELSIQIAPVNDPPTAYDSYEWSQSGLPTSLLLPAYDPDDDELTYEILSGPSNGRLEGDPPQMTYWPNDDSVEQDQLTFQVSDGEFESNIATVLIHIEPVNRAPVAEGLELSTHAEQPLPILLPVFDPDGDFVFINITLGPSNGSLSGIPPDLIYTPNPDFTGYDWFSYTAEDEWGGWTVGYVIINVLPPNVAPIAYPATYNTDEDTPFEFRLEILDPDGGVLNYVIVEPPAHGSLTGELPELVYTPDTNYWGSDVFAFKVSDGELESDPAPISITIHPINDPPIAYPLQVESVQAETTQINLMGLDPDGDELSYRVAEPPSHGRLTGDPPTLVYAPYLTFSGRDQFIYSVSDSTLDSEPAIVTIDILPLDDPSVLAPRIVQIELDEHLLTISCETLPGGLYRLLSKPSLLDANWEPLGDQVEATELTLVIEVQRNPELPSALYAVELVR